MTLTKSIKIDKSALDIIGAMQWEVNGVQVVGKLTGGQLDRKLYEAVNKGLDLLGGKWNRSKGGHVFSTDPREQVAAMLGTGTVMVERDGFFRTPRAVIEQMIDMLTYHGGNAILEPSAGDGAICDVLKEKGFVCEAIERNPQRREMLRSKGHDVLDCDDFLTFDAPRIYSTILMNPPFEELQDVDHVIHAYNLLRGGGELVSVMSNSFTFRDNAKCEKFRDLISIHGYSEELPEGAFKESGTMVKSRLVYLRK